MDSRLQVVDRAGVVLFSFCPAFAVRWEQGSRFLRGEFFGPDMYGPQERLFQVFARGFILMGDTSDDRSCVSVSAGEAAEWLRANFYADQVVSEVTGV